MDTQTIQRVRSHGASIDRFAFDFADRFLDGLFAHCPHLRASENRFRGSHDYQRRCIAHQWAWFVRHLGELDRVTPEFEAMATFFASRGLNEEDFRMARAALLESLRDVSTNTWTAQCESDWAAAFDECVRRLRPVSHFKFVPTSETSSDVAAIAA